MNRSIDDRLERVYENQSQDELKAIYRDWAQTYEHDLIAAGYSHPLACLPLVARYVPSGNARILDAGCGTGLIGPWLQQLGYTNVHGIDASEDMLAEARRKNVYTDLSQAYLGEGLPFSGDRFFAVICMGVFTRGHVGVEGVDDLLHVVKPGGVIIFTVNEAMYDEAGFRQRIEELAEAGHCELIDSVGPYTPTPGETTENPTYCRAVALRVQ